MEDNLDFVELNNENPSEEYSPEYDEKYDEVLELSVYTGENDGSMSPAEIIVPQYDDVEMVELGAKNKKMAQGFVAKIAKFVRDFKDVELTKDHVKYIEDVAKLEMATLTDLLTMVSVNKQMLQNIVQRINSVKGDDYSLIQAYNNLVNQQMRLLKETQILYKSIPSTIKKMRTEILCNQEIESTKDSEEGLDPSNVHDFNNQKTLIKSLRFEEEQKTRLKGLA